MKNKFLLFISTLLFVSNYLFAATDFLKTQRCETGKYGFVDSQGKEVIPCKFDEVSALYREDMITVKINDKYGFIDLRTRAQSIPCEYDEVSEFLNGVAWVKLDGKYKYIDKKGKIVTTPVNNYDEVENFIGGMAKVYSKGKVGFIDNTGKEVISCKYKAAFAFREDLSAVQCDSGYFGFIDKTGKEVIPCIYGLAYPFVNGLSEVTINFEEKLYIDKKGNKYDREIDFVPYFSDFAKKYVDEKMNEWQKKGEYEKNFDYQKRINAAARKDKYASLMKEAEQQYIAIHSKAVSINELALGEYNADKEEFIVRSWRYGDVFVPVHIEEAPIVKANWSKIKKTLQYDIKNDKLAIARIIFTIPKKTDKKSKGHKESSEQKTKKPQHKKNEK